MCVAGCTKNQGKAEGPFQNQSPPASSSFWYYVYWFNPEKQGTAIFPGDTVWFRVFSASDTFQLNYGDGTTSTDTLTSHVYCAPGYYYASLAKGTDTLNKQTIQVSTPPDSGVAAHLAIARAWHYCYTYDCSGGALHDTFAVTLLGKGRIIFQGDTLAFNGVYDTSTTAPYIVYSGTQGPPYHGCDFDYYYMQDSIYAQKWSDSSNAPDFFFSP